MIRRITNLVRLVSLSTSVCVLICCSFLGSDLTTSWRVLSQQGLSHAGPFHSIIFFDELNGFALTALGLASTTDGGTNWTWLLESGNRGFYSMRFVDRQTGWIVGAESKPSEGDSAIGSTNRSPFILKTEDGGKAWRGIDLNQFLSSEGTKFSTFFSICTEHSGTVWLAGNAGIVEATIQSDKLRTSQVTTTRAAVKDLSCNDSGEVWAVGDNGLVMHYRGKNWASIEYPNGSAFYNRVKVIGNAVWITGGIRERGQDGATGLLASSRNESAWENRTPPEAGLLFDLDLSENEGWLVGVQGSIYYTNNGGTTWKKESSPTENDLFSVFLNAKQGWIGGDKLIVLGLKQTHRESVK